MKPAMDQFRKIIVATDFSQPSIEALREADLIAHRTGAQLIVLHAIPNVVRSNPLFPHRNIEDAFKLPAAMDSAAEAVEQVIASHIHHDSERVQVVVDTGWPDATVMRHAEQLGADLVVLGSRGHTGLKHVLLGSVAERVVRYAHCAVLIARASPQTGRILAATDFSDPALPAIDAAVVVAKRRGASLSVLHSLGVRPRSMMAAASPFGGGAILPDREGIESAKDAAKGLIKDCLARFHGEGEAVVTEGLAEEDIVQTAARLPADLVVLGSIGRTRLHRIALGNVAETVARSAPCSVLVIRSPTK